MIKRILLLFFTAFLFSFSLLPQDEEILMTIDGRNINLAEFSRMYKKNNSLGFSETPDIDEYINLFINFKLKVIEAENLQLDTSATFRNELNGYIKQLAKPYLSDSLSFEQLLVDAYGRLKNEINASHIMLMLDEKASPEDTLVAYNKILEIRNRILKGEDFSLLAKTYSEDPSVSNNGGIWDGSGHLRWFILSNQQLTTLFPDIFPCLYDQISVITS
jgi:peptidyl-prolyl cis-trans isomerase SurA